jgi:hypothetical protein
MAESENIPGRIFSDNVQAERTLPGLRYCQPFRGVYLCTQRPGQIKSRVARVETLRNYNTFRK